jgi:hypothetical protein
VTGRSPARQHLIYSNAPGARAKQKAKSSVRQPAGGKGGHCFAPPTGPGPAPARRGEGDAASAAVPARDLTERG